MTNSDDSDYENENYENEDDSHRMEEKDTCVNYFSDHSGNEGQSKKRKHKDVADDASDLNDSDCEQESGDEGSSQNIRSGHIDDTVLSSNEEAEESRTMMSAYHNSYNQFSKRRKFSSTEDKTDEDSSEEEKSYDTKEQVIKQIPNNNALDGQDKAKRMMRIMGYTEGHGLGKNMQGRLEPVQTAKQHGRRGLGHHVPGLEASSLKWDPAEEEVSAIEAMEWIKNQHRSLPTMEEMRLWLKKGPKKLTIDDETQFCDEDILTNILSSKTVFDKLDSFEVRCAVSRCNPYEKIRGVFFLNRAAVKMANMDKACKFMFTKPKDLQSDRLLYFADVCAGPGGFSEYVLWRKKWHAKGFGFTLKNENDFKLADFYAGPCETFHPYYGPKDNGDVYDPDNQEAFKNLVMTHTHGQGVHFMMADGGFSVEGQENLQEILSKQLYLCQCLVALMIVRVKGHFVTKLFDLFTPFSAGLVYLMYRCFDEICIFKPNSSRPANSERYLICKGKRPDTEDIVTHLKYVNQLLLKNDKNSDVIELVAADELERETHFVQYLRASNNYLGRKQILSLRKIAAFCEDSTLIESKQADMRTECLKYWDLPNNSRTRPSRMKPQDRLNFLLKKYTSSFLSKQPKPLTESNLENTILTHPFDWFCMPCSTEPDKSEKESATIYMSMGRSMVYRYVKGSWQLVDDIKIELPPDTIVYAEVVCELRKECKQMSRVRALHILDALFLGTEDVGQHYLRDRHELLKKFCEALWKPDGNTHSRIRVKELIPVGPHISQKLQVTERVLKNNLLALTYNFSDMPFPSNTSESDKPYFIPRSIIFLTSLVKPWHRYFSKTYSSTYVFNYVTNVKEYDNRRPPKAAAGFIQSFENRMTLEWPNNKKLTMDTLVRYIKGKCPEFNEAIDY